MSRLFNSIFILLLTFFFPFSLFFILELKNYFYLFIYLLFLTILWLSPATSCLWSYYGYLVFVVVVLVAPCSPNTYLHMCFDYSIVFFDFLSVFIFVLCSIMLLFALDPDSDSARV